MRLLITLTAIGLFAISATSQAAESGCEVKAADKHLSGAAKTSFVQKCEKDAKAGSAQATCEAQAAEKKLYGAAKNSFVKKCVTDAAK
jgi:hypothetical protein